MTDIATIAELGTATGTLFLGAATFASVRSANRAARVAERSLLLGLRPVLTPSRPEDPDQEIIFGDGRTFPIPSGSALVEVIDEVVYMAIPLRNVGAGLAVLQKYDLITDNPLHGSHRPLDHGMHDRHERRFRPIEDFRLQQRDLYVASGDIGYWQAALRDSADPVHDEVMQIVEDGAAPISVDLLYGDHEGGQHSVSRFNLVPEAGGGWNCTVVFHWILEGKDPRDFE